jgi:hypothetical protein
MSIYAKSSANRRRPEVLRAQSSPAHHAGEVDRRANGDKEGTVTAPDEKRVVLVVRLPQLAAYVEAVATTDKRDESPRPRRRQLIHRKPERVPLDAFGLLGVRGQRTTAREGGLVGVGRGRERFSVSVSVLVGVGWSGEKSPCVRA